MVQDLLLLEKSWSQALGAIDAVTRLEEHKDRHF